MFTKRYVFYCEEEYIARRIWKNRYKKISTMVVRPAVHQNYKHKFKPFVRPPYILHPNRIYSDKNQMRYIGGKPPYREYVCHTTWYSRVTMR